MVNLISISRFRNLRISTINALIKHPVRIFAFVVTHQLIKSMRFRILSFVGICLHLLVVRFVVISVLCSDLYNIAGIFFSLLPLIIVLSVIWFADSDYSFDIFKLISQISFGWWNIMIVCLDCFHNFIFLYPSQMTSSKFLAFHRYG